MIFRLFTHREYVVLRRQIFDWCVENIILKPYTNIHIDRYVVIMTNIVITKIKNKLINYFNENRRKIPNKILHQILKHTYIKDINGVIKTKIYMIIAAFIELYCMYAGITYFPHIDINVGILRFYIPQLYVEYLSKHKNHNMNLYKNIVEHFSYGYTQNTSNDKKYYMILDNYNIDEYYLKCVFLRINLYKYELIEANYHNETNTDTVIKISNYYKKYDIFAKYLLLNLNQNKYISK